MELSQILLGEADNFLRGDISDVKCDANLQPCLTPIEQDVLSLKQYIGETGFKSGLCIEITLKDLLSVVPRKRRRTDAYTTLVRHLKDEWNINLIIKTNRNEKENIYHGSSQRI